MRRTSPMLCGKLVLLVSQRSEFSRARLGLVLIGAPCLCEKTKGLSKSRPDPVLVVDEKGKPASRQMMKSETNFIECG